MSTESHLAVEERLFQLLQHLGIAQAHFAASIPGDVTRFATAHARSLASLTLLCPFYLDPNPLAPCASRLLLVTGRPGATRGPGPARCGTDPRGHPGDAPRLLQSPMG